MTNPTFDGGSRSKTEGAARLAEIRAAVETPQPNATENQPPDTVAPSVLEEPAPTEIAEPETDILSEPVDDYDHDGMETEFADEDFLEAHEEQDNDLDEPTFEIKINGKPTQVSESELLMMASKAEGADAKFAEAAEKRKEAEAIQSKYSERAKSLDEQYALVEQLLGNTANDEQTLAKIADDYGYASEEYHQAKANLENKSRGIKALQEQRQLLQAETAKQEANDALAMVKAKMPELLSDDRKSALVSYLRDDMGLNDAQMQTVNRSGQALLAFEKARQFDALQAKKPEVDKKVAKAQRHAKTGARKQKKVNPHLEARKRAEAKLSKSTRRTEQYSAGADLLASIKANKR